MTLARTVLFAVPFALAALTGVRDAEACGGCFVPSSESTQVTGHRMVLSVSQSQSTLWDQITYAGDPASFAWVLPTKGVVEIGLSSDLLFNTLDSLTQYVVIPPWDGCLPSSCNMSTGFSASAGASGAGGGGGGVTVIAEEVVGPYETVQLSASDPQALQTWLAGHGYEIPPDVQPVVDEYVTEGFNFLALKLVPGQGIDSMRPIRVTTPGASPALPLRMVAAGTGAFTPISLWVMGEGRYEPKNFPSFEIDPQDLVWDWDTSSSNLTALREAGFAASQKKSWIVEAGEPVSPFSIENTVMGVVYNLPEQSGYGDGDFMVAETEAMADLQDLYGGIQGLWVTRLFAELPKAALATDLLVGASADQSQVARFFEVTQTTGTAPVCPPDPCATSGNGASATGTSGPAGTSGTAGTSGNGASGAGGAGGALSAEGGGGCAVGGGDGLPTLAGVGLALALGLARRRRARLAGRANSH